MGKTAAPEYLNPAAYAKHNPIDHVSRWKTPTLVIHGQLDYRVPDSQGLSVFTALQRRGIPSELLYFPNENHWVLKPADSHSMVRRGARLAEPLAAARGARAANLRPQPRGGGLGSGTGARQGSTARHGRRVIGAELHDPLQQHGRSSCPR